MSIFDNQAIVLEGTWLYAGLTPVRLKVTQSPITWGTGDYEDPPEIADHQDVPCYFLHYEMAGAPGNFCNVVPNLHSLEAAVAYAEERFFGVQWHTPTIQSPV